MEQDVATTLGQKVCQKYREGFNCREIGELENLSEIGVNRRLQPYLTTALRRQHRINQLLRKPRNARILTLYLAGHYQAAIGQQLHMDQSVVSDVLKVLLTPRLREHARRNQLSRKQSNSTKTPASLRRSARAQKMLELYMAGYTQAEIGQQSGGISHKRVGFILKPFLTPQLAAIAHRNRLIRQQGSDSLTQEQPLQKHRGVFLEETAIVGVLMAAEAYDECLSSRQYERFRRTGHRNLPSAAYIMERWGWNSIKLTAGLPIFLNSTVVDTNTALQLRSASSDTVSR